MSCQQISVRTYNAHFLLTVIIFSSYRISQCVQRFVLSRVCLCSTSTLLSHWYPRIKFKYRIRDYFGLFLNAEMIEYLFGFRIQKLNKKSNSENLIKNRIQI
jgi:hypothetical protein